MSVHRKYSNEAFIRVPSRKGSGPSHPWNRDRIGNTWRRTENQRRGVHHAAVHQSLAVRGSEVAHVAQCGAL